MLVLTRRVGHKVRIGHQITITVMEIGNREIKLAISAPDQVPISRGEDNLRTADHERFDDAAIPTRSTTDDHR